MTTGIEIVRTSGIDDDVVELGAIAFSRARAQQRHGAFRRYLEWKYLQNPYLDEPILYVARASDGTALAMRGFYGARWSTPLGVLDMPCADDFAVASQHRSSGIATQIMRHAHADLAELGVKYVVSTSGGKVTMLQSLAMGWKSVVAIDPLDRKLGERRGSGRVRAYMRSRTEAFRRTGWRLGDEDGVSSTPDAEAMEALTERVSSNDVLRHVRDAAFYRWRYANPDREYRFLVARSEDRATGYIVIGRHRSKRNTAPLYIADWEGETADVRASLLERAVELCGSATIRVWAASSSEATREILHRLDFQPAQPELRAHGMPCVLFRSLVSHDPEVATIAGSTWDVRLIDSMHG